MTEKLILSIYEMTGKTILTGGGPGLTLSGKIIDTVGVVKKPTVLCLDFKGVEFISSSYFNTGILGTRNFYRSPQSDVYPLLANLADPLREEVEFLLETIFRDALLVCRLDARGNIKDPQIVGVLDEKQQLTLNAVIALKTANASVLRERFQEENIGITGWNNRLASLVAKGLLIETKKGKVKYYQPLLGV